jgi:Ice-binding-like/Bacterial Ig-like domain
MSGRARWVVVGLLVVGFGSAVPSALASTPAVNLGQAASYAVLSGASVANTVSAPGAPHTTLRGDLGVSVNAQPTGFPPGVVTGTTRIGAAAAPAVADLTTAYNGVAARTGGTPITGDLNGVTLTPGLYSAGAAISDTGTLTLDGRGDPNAVFVFEIGAALNLAAGAKVELINGAQASNVFWQVDGATAIGADATFVGTDMSLTAIAVGAGSEVNGRALSLNGAISLDDDGFYSAPPVVTITGGANVATNDSTPTISGTTDVVAPEVVTVTVAGQTLSAIPLNGAWSVNPGLLANGSYPIVASVVDGAGNTGSTSENLTINTIPPLITITGGASVTTNNPTRTIAGTSNAVPGTIVNVVVDAQILTALVQSNGAWSVAPSALSNGTRTVTVLVSDAAGNVSTAQQSLTVNTFAPGVMITGGLKALTDDSTPTITGTAKVPVGTPVTVNLADQTLTGLVRAGGAWSVTTAHLSDGTHRIVMSVTDLAGNVATYTQTLTVDTVAPAVTIVGGDTSATQNVDPTITGTSNAARGTTVTVTIGGQTMDTLLQANGTWNVTPSPIGYGTFKILASAPDPAGNVGSAKQTLSVAVDAPAGVDNTSAAEAASAATSLAVPISCVGRKSCHGSVSATSVVTSRGGKQMSIAASGGKTAKTKKGSKTKTAAVKVASGTYTVAAGKKAKVAIKLNTAGRKLLNRFYRVPSTLKITGAVTSTRKMTFSYKRVHAVVSSTWTFGKGYSLVRVLTVSSLPVGSKVELSCAGGGCPFAKRAFAAPKNKFLALAPVFHSANLKPGAIVQVTVSVAGQVGTVARFMTRSGQLPAQTSLCVVPGARAPAGCVSA